MIDENSLKIVLLNAGQVAKPVRLIVFTKDTGGEPHEAMVRLARAIKDHMGKIALETYDVVMDRDKTEQYDIQRVPSMVVQSGDGQLITFYGMIGTDMLSMLVNTVRALSDAKPWLPEEIRQTLKRLAKDVTIQVFVDSSSTQSRSAAETAINLAIESMHITTTIIIARDFPELMKKYTITVLPKIIIGENLQKDGELPLSDFTEMIFHAEGAKPGPDKRCLVCGALSSDSICATCKNRIQAEALDHKLKIEKQKQPDAS